MSELLISHLTNAYDVLRDLREREGSEMAHKCRVITNILKPAAGGCKVGSLCVKCRRRTSTIKMPKIHLLKSFNLGKRDEVAY